MTSKTVMAMIKAKLELRWNPTYNTYEVYTTKDGGTTFQWLRISNEIAVWYRDNFDLALPNKD
jgi:hypothetical protein